MHLPPGGGTSTFPDPPGVADFHCWCEWPWPHDAGTQPPCPARPGPGQPLGVPNPCGRSQVSRPRTPAPPIVLPLPRRHIDKWPDGPVHIPVIPTGVPSSHIPALLPPACMPHHIVPPGVSYPNARRQFTCPTTPARPRPRALPRRQPENCPGYACQHASTASRRPQPSWPASIPLPPRRRHPTFTRSYPRHAPITWPGLFTGVPNPTVRRHLTYPHDAALPNPPARTTPASSKLSWIPPAKFQLYVPASQPTWPASIPLPPQHQHATFTRSYSRHAPVTLPALPTGVPNPSGPASSHLSSRRRYPQFPRTFHTSILKTVLDCPVHIPAPSTGVPNPDGRRHFPCPHDAGIPNTPTPPHPWPAWPRQIAGTASRRPQPPPPRCHAVGRLSTRA